MHGRKNFLYWFLVVCCTALSSAVAQHYGFWHAMMVRDETMITWIIAVVTVVTTAAIGRQALKPTRSIDTMNRLWFVSDAMITLGMIGTVAGFLIMMGDSFNGLDAKDPAAIQKTIQTVGAGMGTVLVTTLMGLIASVLLKIQLVIVDNEE